MMSEAMSATSKYSSAVKNLDASTRLRTDRPFEALDRDAQIATLEPLAYSPAV